MAAVAVLADRLGRRFGDLEAVRNISFEVAEGEAFGLLGPIGRSGSPCRSQPTATVSERTVRRGSTVRVR
jgi:ABC-type uncharacterized transport system, ATPase component